MSIAYNNNNNNNLEYRDIVLSDNIKSFPGM